MKLIDINPFVRYAMHNRLLSSEYASKSLDNRIFYIEEDGGDVIINGKKYPVRTNMLILFQCGTEYLFTNKNVIPAISINFDYTQDKCHITTPYKIVNAYNNQEQFSKIHPIEFEDCPPLNSPIIIQDAK